MAEKRMHIALVWTFAVFWSFVSILRLIWRVWKVGAEVWTQKPHPKPKVLDGWNEDFVELKNNIRLHYIWAGDKSKPLLLMVHGFPEFWYSWRHQIRFFQNFFYVVAVDLRGYNTSSKPSAIADYKEKTLAKDLRDTIIALGREKAFVMAHDWGALISWELAIAYPELVEKLVILNVPHPHAFLQHFFESYTQKLKSWYMFLFQIPYLPEFLLRAEDYKMFDGMLSKVKTITPEDLEAWKYTFSQPDALRGPLNFYRALWQYQEIGEATTVEPETLIVWGTEDTALEKEGATLSLQFCRKARVEFIEGASHWVQQDEPDKVNAVVKEFLGA